MCDHGDGDGDGGGDGDDDGWVMMMVMVIGGRNPDPNPHLHPHPDPTPKHERDPDIAVVSWFQDPVYPDGDPLWVRVGRTHSQFGRKVVFLDRICPVRVSYEIDDENNCLNMMRKGVDMFRLGEWSF